MGKDLNLQVSSAPHLHAGDQVSTAMRDVTIALMPVTLVACYFFKLNVPFLILVCVVTAIFTEVIFRRAMRKEPQLQDGSAILTGVLVALSFSAATPWWLAAAATFIAVGLAKEFLGGLGWNRFNPALFGRVSVILFAPWLVYLNNEFFYWRVSFPGIDTVTQATPLTMLQMGLPLPNMGTFFIATQGGGIAESSALALLIGGAYLLYKKHITWHIPVSMLATVFVGTAVLGEHPIYHLLSGGLLLGAFFMATDWVTSPITKKGKIIFGVCIGIIVVVFRVLLAPTEGVAFAILIMNAFVPLIDRLTRRKKFGEPVVQRVPQAVPASVKAAAKN
ncbi:MAG TPA: RnfABCDGE type electron transport complex subunit D [Oscillospiraceae bacterium]|nr:RnfABCDGE type electron transport complex subunit D [Oscillospiraceae bacterium]